MTSAAPAGRWLELAVTCDGEAVESVSELFASHGFNQGVAIEEAFTQDPDGDNFAVDPSQPVIVRTFLNAADVAPETIEEIRQALWHLGRLRSISDLQVTDTQRGGLGQCLERALQRPSCRTPRAGEGALA